MRPSSPFPPFKRYRGAGRCSLEAVPEDLAETGQGSTSLAVREAQVWESGWFVV